ncbi:MAG: NAD(P)H-dependent oxidoreductase subunit E [Alphaproteobacteria bacterium GM7ARS4]|nr:NAD(P)H-dependent oxidoreductase subunit E [Alphaproteobacteria bacterium GM7ARS4]
MKKKASQDVRRESVASDTPVLVDVAQLEEQKNALMPHYPPHGAQSMLLPLLHYAQDHSGGWLPPLAMERVAHVLGLAPIRVYEVASFHTMFHLSPMPKHCLGVCMSLPCWLGGSRQLMEACRAMLCVKGHQGLSQDGTIYLLEQECLGACVDAPVVTIDGAYKAKMDEEAMARLVASLNKGEDDAQKGQ